jgi:hypothetical protein
MLRQWSSGGFYNVSRHFQGPSSFQKMSETHLEEGTIVQISISRSRNLLVNEWSSGIFMNNKPIPSYDVIQFRRQRLTGEGQGSSSL